MPARVHIDGIRSQSHCIIDYNRRFHSHEVIFLHALRACLIITLYINKT